MAEFAAAAMAEENDVCVMQGGSMVEGKLICKRALHTDLTDETDKSR
jgi:hypothetical protein